MRYLAIRREELKESWAQGDLAAPSIEEFAIQQAAAQGACSIIQDILGIEYIDLRKDNEE
jgi:hypothetical protein